MDIARVVRLPALAGLLVAATVAFGQAAMPQPQVQGTVTFLNGGAGDEEVQFIKGAMRDYNVALAFARSTAPRAEYVASVAVTIKDANGATVLESPSVGPYLLVRLPAGRYSVAATYQNQAQTRPVTAGKNAPPLVTIEWK